MRQIDVFASAQDADQRVRIVTPAGEAGVGTTPDDVAGPWGV